MRSISEYCQNGIVTLEELREALKLAMQMEFATIPPYLCAQWSIVEDPDRVEGMIHHIVGQEMNHLALVGNILSALGCQPKLSDQGFLPKYPLSELPGGIDLDNILGLKSFSRDQLAIFMDIEKPHDPHMYIDDGDCKPGTIGEFYQSIIGAFRLINPNILPNSKQIPVEFSPIITTVEDAITVLERVQDEGEGTIESPIQPTPDGHSLAHYYLFREVYEGRRLEKTHSGWSYTGNPVRFPRAVDTDIDATEPGSEANFTIVFEELLLELDACWKDGAALSVANMFRLGQLGRKLMRLGIVPKFQID